MSLIILKQNSTVTIETCIQPVNADEYLTPRTLHYIGPANTRLDVYRASTELPIEAKLLSQTLNRFV